MTTRWLLLFLLVPSVAILMQRGYFPIHDDLQVMRQLQLTKCFSDHQFPCRWVPDMAGGFGYPLFNFYPPLPYFVGHLFHLVNFSYIGIAKILGIIGFLAAGVAMYLLTAELWGNRGGLVSALIYIYAPYHSVDFYVRAAVAEFYALIFLPLIFWFTLRLIKSSNTKWFIALSLSLVGLLLSHNLTVLMFAPFYLVWISYWLWKYHTLKPLGHLVISAIFALSLAAFFTLPVLFDQKFIHTESLTAGYFNYTVHFLDISQIFFKINWGYGGSTYGPDDRLSLAVGYLQWLIPLIIIFSRKYRSLILILTACFFASLFLTHSKSTFIWQLLPPLQILQFPWRFLSLAIFLSAIVCGAITQLFNSRLTLALIITLSLILNGNYFQPKTWYPRQTDQDIFSGDSWLHLQNASNFDYLPIYAPLPPAHAPVADLVFISGSGTFNTLVKKSNLQTYQLQITSPSIVQLQTLYFPGWKLFLDNHEVAIDPSLDPLLGRPQANLFPGYHTLSYVLTSTPIHSISNWLSVVSWLGLVILLLFKLK